MGALSLLREWPKLTIFCWARMAPTWSRMIGLAKRWNMVHEDFVQMSSANFFFTSRYSLLPSMLTYSVLYPSANIVQQKCFRDEGPLDWHEVGRWSSCNLHKKRVWWESLRFLVYGGLCHAPLVFNWLRLAARMFPKVLITTIQNHFLLSSWVQPDNVQDTIGHLAAKVILDQTCFAPVSQIILKQKLR